MMTMVMMVESPLRSKYIPLHDHLCCLNTYSCWLSNPYIVLVKSPFLLFKSPCLMVKSPMIVGHITILDVWICLNHPLSTASSYLLLQSSLLLKSPFFMLKFLRLPRSHAKGWGPHLESSSPTRAVHSPPAAVPLPPWARWTRPHSAGPKGGPGPGDLGMI